MNLIEVMNKKPKSILEQMLIGTRTFDTVTPYGYSDEIRTTISNEDLFPYRIEERYGAGLLTPRSIVSDRSQSLTMYTPQMTREREERRSILRDTILGEDSGRWL